MSDELRMLKMFEDGIRNGSEWHLQFTYDPELPCPFPIVPAGSRDKHDPVGHLTSDGTVHVFNDGIIERLVRAGLRARAGRVVHVLSDSAPLSVPLNLSMWWGGGSAKNRKCQCSGPGNEDQSCSADSAKIFGTTAKCQLTESYSIRRNFPGS